MESQRILDKMRRGTAWIDSHSLTHTQKDTNFNTQNQNKVSFKQFTNELVWLHAQNVPDITCTSVRCHNSKYNRINTISV